MKSFSSPKRITYIVWLVCVTLALIVSTLTGCIVVSEAQYYDPLYQNPTIVYDVWPQSNYFYNYSNTTYIYPKPKKKKRIAPTIIQNAPKGSPLRGKGFGTAYDETLARLEKNARAMDKSKKGKKLISNTPVKKSKEPKTKGNYRTGRNYATPQDYA